MKKHLLHINHKWRYDPRYLNVFGDGSTRARCRVCLKETYRPEREMEVAYAKLGDEAFDPLYLEQAQRRWPD